MLRKALVMVVFAAACQGCEDDSPITVTFRVVDQTGTPVINPDVSCWGEVPCDLECGPGGPFSTVEGVVVRRGDDYGCTVSDEVVNIFLEAHSGNHSAEMLAIHDVELQTLVMWRPEVTFAQADGILEATWPPPPAPTADWTSTLDAFTTPPVAFARPPTLSGVAIYLQDLEALDSLTLDLRVEHRLGGRTVDQDVRNIPIPLSVFAP